VTIQAKPSGGTALTLGVARQQGKPHLHISRERITSIEEAGQRVADFLAEHAVHRLNIAGPRASQEPEIAEFVDRLLFTAFHHASDHFKPLINADGR
jgi:hypothetical protein